MKMTIPSDFFLIDKGSDYFKWRDRKLSKSPRSVEELVVEIKNPESLSNSEVIEITNKIRRANMAIYVTGSNQQKNPDIPRAIMRALGVTRFDVNPEAGDTGVTELTPKDKQELKGPTEYIPYSTNAISWHTDGYYNTADKRVRSLALHCVRQSDNGGENDLFDHEIAYILLREKDKKLADALFADDVMTIPFREENGVIVRPDVTGPVFTTENGSLHMRYTHRTKSIVWKDDPTVTEAIKSLRAILEGKSEYILEAKLMPGWGLICNNVLHTRRAFSRSDHPRDDRLLYRLRYYDRI